MKRPNRRALRGRGIRSQPRKANIQPKGSRQQIQSPRKLLDYLVGRKLTVSGFFTSSEQGRYERETQRKWIDTIDDHDPPYVRKSGKYVQLSDQVRIEKYIQEAQIQKRTLMELSARKNSILSALYSSRSIESAKKKLEQLKRSAVELPFSELTSNDDYLKSVLPHKSDHFVGVPQRFELLSSFLAQLMKPIPYHSAGNFLNIKELMVLGSPFASQKRPPADLARRQWELANQLMGSQTYIPFRCRIFLTPKCVSNLGSFGRSYWGNINSPHANPVLGVQIFHSDPRVLLEFSQLMAKVRPHDPIPILDLYGNVFYP